MGIKPDHLDRNGRAVAQIRRATVRRIEQEWPRQIGSKRFNEFYDVLKALTDGKTCLPSTTLKREE
jgi:hypothetical protein